MDVLTAVTTRRSERHLTEPAPGDEEFLRLLGAAALAPDHGSLRPWRWILIRGEGRDALAACFDGESDPTRRPRSTNKTLRAPLLATLVFTPRADHRVPTWEQLAATSAMAHSMMLLLHAHHYGSVWRTGAMAASDRVSMVLGLTDDEQLLGWLYVGTPRSRCTVPRPQPVDLVERVAVFRGEEPAASPGAATGH